MGASGAATVGGAAFHVLCDAGVIRSLRFSGAFNNLIGPFDNPHFRRNARHRAKAACDLGFYRLRVVCLAEDGDSSIGQCFD
jgi:hypothetical protein